MFAILHALGMFVADPLKSRTRLEAENLFLRHQLTIALRQAPPRLRLRVSDRALLIAMTRFCPSLLGMSRLVQRRPSCGGIAPASKLSGAGNPAIGQGGRRSIGACVISSGR